MPTALDQLKERLAEVADLRRVAQLAAWDQRVMMPPGGSAMRAEQLATLERIAHERLVDDSTAALLDAADAEAGGEAGGEHDRAYLRVARRDVTRARAVPGDLAAELARAGARGEDAWERSRAADDWASFAPFLTRNVELARELSRCLDPLAADPMDPLLEEFEEGLTWAEVERVLGGLRDELVPLVLEASARGVDDTALLGHYPQDAQRAVVLDIVSRAGYAPDGWRLDPAPHPFCASPARGDHRLTGRFDERDLRPGVLFLLHEFGHGLYEASFPAEDARGPLGDLGGSMSLHESQSRFWECVIGRSQPFWRWLVPRLAAAGLSLPTTDPAAWFAGVNRIVPGAIRVDADETSYVLHIALRAQLEHALVSGDLGTADVPAAWRDGMRELLGIEVAGDADGALQDPHWGGGAFGYFPTYALGSLIAHQLGERIHADMPDLDDRLARGELEPVRAWLHERVHAIGRRRPPAGVLEHAVGGPVDPAPFLRQVRARQNL